MFIDDESDTRFTDGEPLPGWRVVSLIDPHATGQDVAYTQGLAAFDAPELLLWARPTEGCDPGADWLLSHRERSRLLTGWAMDLILGRLGPGTEREERFDGGHTVARFRFGRPVLATPAGHPHLTEPTWLLSVAWSLERRRPSLSGRGRARALTQAAECRMRRWIAASEATTLAWRSRLSGTGRPAELPADLASLSIAVPSPDRFGPMTPWVDARIRQVLAADAEVIGAFLRRLLLADHARREDQVIEQLAALAHHAHRGAAFREASRAAQELALVTVPLQAPDRAGPLTSMTDQPPNVVLTDGLEVLLLTAVVSDLAATPLRASGSGPWDWAAGDERLPGRPWLAAAPARHATRTLLASATPGQLVTAAGRARAPFGLDERHVLSHVLGGLQTTTAASAKPGSLFRRDQRRGLPPSTVRAAERLAGQLLTALAWPHRLPPGGWDLVRDTVYPLAPDLPVNPGRVGRSGSR